MGDTVFIVEDEMILNQHIAQFLEKRGYRVEMLPSGEECLATLSSGHIPDIILMDNHLGSNRLDGPATMQRINKKYEIPVVLHSAYTDKKSIDKTRKMSRYGYIQKVPGNEEVIFATVELALKVHRTEQELKRRESLYRELSKHLQNIREEQNAYLAREIHDEFGQSLTALRMNLTLIEQLSEETIQADTIKKTIGDMERILDHTVKKVRKISTELRPSVLDSSGIMEAIEWQIEEFREYFDVDVLFDREEEDIELEQRTALMIFRIVQEAMTNSVRHGAATRIHIVLQLAGEELTLRIEDNGCGFIMENTERLTTMGLLGMRERALQSGGCFSIHSSPGEGTMIQVKIPCEAGAG
jgi:signal transduction histidine kinase